MAFFSHDYRSEFWNPDDRWFFSTNSDLFYTYLQYKCVKNNGLFGWDWKNQEHTVSFFTARTTIRVYASVIKPPISVKDLQNIVIRGNFVQHQLLRAFLKQHPENCILLPFLNNKYYWAFSTFNFEIC